MGNITPIQLQTGKGRRSITPVWWFCDFYQPETRIDSIHTIFTLFSTVVKPVATVPASGPTVSPSNNDHSEKHPDLPKPCPTVSSLFYRSPVFHFPNGIKTRFFCDKATVTRKTCSPRTVIFLGAITFTKKRGSFKFLTHRDARKSHQMSHV